MAVMLLENFANEKFFISRIFTHWSSEIMLVKRLALNAALSNKYFFLQVHDRCTRSAVQAAL